MELIISNASNQPIYEQIVQQIKQHILTGTLAEEEMLPSIRALAKDLRISVITTKRAYEELEREGFIYTVAGKGCFVAGRSSDWVKEDLLRKIEAHLLEAAHLAALAGIGREELGGMLALLWEEE